MYGSTNEVLAPIFTHEWISWWVETGLRRLDRQSFFGRLDLLAQL